jgi:beta-glucuronidase
MTTKMVDEWRFKIHVELYRPGLPKTGQIAFLLSAPDGRAVWQETVPAGQDKINISGSLSEVEPWSPGSPVLYRLSAKLGNHEISVRTAFREIAARGSEIYLNGDPIKLYGLNYHEDHEDYGNAMPLTVMQADLDTIASLGCNFIRTSHYTPHPYVFDYCDENGILVWTEIPAWKTSVESLTDESVWQNYIAPQLEAMVSEFRHHPSVILWSVGNEFRSNNEGVANYVKRAVEYVKSLDDSRLVTFASDKRLTDKAAGYVDVISWNEYYGWYYGTINDIGPVLDEGHRKWPDKPILISEFGAGGPIDRPKGGGDAVRGKHYSLEYQNRMVKLHLEQIFDPKRAGFVAGAAFWCFSDYADPHRYGKGHPAQWYQINTKGLVTRDRRPKPVFEIVKNFYLMHQEQSND